MHVRFYCVRSFLTLNLLTSFRFKHYLDPSKRQPHPPCSFCTDSIHLNVYHVLYHVFLGEEHCSFHYKQVRKAVFVYNTHVTAIRRGGCIKSWHLFAPKNPQYQSNETSAMAFFAYVYTGSFPVYVCDTRTQAQAKAQEDKNCFITRCEYLLLRRVVACPNRDDATKHTSWVNVGCVVCVKGNTHSDLTVLILVCDTV